MDRDLIQFHFNYISILVKLIQFGLEVDSCFDCLTSVCFNLLYKQDQESPTQLYQILKIIFQLLTNPELKIFETIDDEIV